MGSLPATAPTMQDFNYQNKSKNAPSFEIGKLTMLQLAVKPSKLTLLSEVNTTLT
jgi:hypothetical protein